MTKQRQGTFPHKEGVFRTDLFITFCITKIAKLNRGRTKLTTLAWSTRRDETA